MIDKKAEREFIQKETESFLKDNKISKFKLVKNKPIYRKPNSMSLAPCPECGSKLVTELSGVIVCSQDRLKTIYDRCLEYEKADAKGKIEILKDDKNGNFMELYERWAHKDAKGQRSAFVCNYSNKLHNATPSYNWYIYEPWQVKELESKLKRSLTQNELDGLVKVVYTSKKGTRIEEEIRKYRYPWDLL